MEKEEEENMRMEGFWFKNFGPFVFVLGFHLHVLLVREALFNLLGEEGRVNSQAGYGYCFMWQLDVLFCCNFFETRTYQGDP
jgi:hypothetical protein